jgi:hypothetical protein
MAEMPAWAIALASQSACFVRRLCSLPDLSYQFGVSIGDIYRVNPYLSASPVVHGGQLLILPTRAQPRDRRRSDDFDLKPLRMTPEQFETSVERTNYMDHDWFPPLPGFPPADREPTFGRFEYVDDTSGDPDGIRITDGWDTKNIGAADVPELKGIPYGWGTQHASGKVHFYKKAHEQLRGMFTAWANADLIRVIKTWDGAHNPRYMRKATHVRRNLSNHAWGTALDINAKWNPLGTRPARLDQPGCVFELVEIAHQYGFYWGGHFGGGRPDGMHFEVGRLL